MSNEQQPNDRTKGIPTIIQGGMGVGVSNWRLARAVGECGQMGVVSGTALDSVFVRRLQLGDPEGAVRRALAHFPWPGMARRALEAYWVEGGIAPGTPFKTVPMTTAELTRTQTELLVMANFCEVFLAREGNSAPVGINYLEKVQLPTLPSLLGAMLAGVDAILMGGGIPLAIPGILDRLARWEPVEKRLEVVGSGVHGQHLAPAELAEGALTPLQRPAFLAIVSSDVVAKALLRRASGAVDGFIVENHTAGGHNAPPRRAPQAEGNGASAFGPKDVPDLAGIRALERPFWLAGGYGSPEDLRAALAEGARGIQAGTVFACCRESGLAPHLKEALLRHSLAGEIEIITDLRASPTGYPFKLAPLPEAPAGHGPVDAARRRVCDLGYLRTIYEREDGSLGYRCPAEPVAAYLAKGGALEDTVGRRCLCNGLAAAIGFGQARRQGVEPPMVTAGEQLRALRQLVAEKGLDYTARDVIEYLES
jgi:NAD(P)H-dependent flavin oxidoreductase YrpB (nitropropane dioxygenase family)